MNPFPLSRRHFLASAALAAAPSGGDWIPLFDGQSFNGWKPSENTASWKIEGGCLRANGQRSHLFYQGTVKNADFKNFELEVEYKTVGATNSGVFFHTKFQDKGWPDKGFEVQICNTHLGEGNYRERKKTGSLYGVRNVYKAFTKDDEWTTLNIQVRANRVQVRLNGMLTVDFVEPKPPVLASDGRGRFLDHGTFALQGHDPASTVLFRKVLLRPLPDDLPVESPPVVDDTYRAILELGARNVPVVDYHSHLKMGLTLEELLRRSRATGIFYGVAINCGKGFTVENRDGIQKFVADMRGAPIFVAMQAEGREWINMFSSDDVAQFDYVFTDSMTWTDNRGRRMRTWIKEEVGEISDTQEFMVTLVARAVGILEREPIDIYVNPTFIPDQIQPRYDELWTDERMRKVILAAKKNDVAIEMNDRYKLPSPKFLRMAKEEGLKFTFGTNNAGPDDLRRCDYGLKMTAELKLGWQDFFIPKPNGEKPVQRRGMPKS